MEPGSRLFYSLDSQKTHSFDYLVNQAFLLTARKLKSTSYPSHVDSEIILQTSALAGKLDASIKIYLKDEEMGNFSGAIKHGDNLVHDPSFLIVKISEIVQVL